MLLPRAVLKARERGDTIGLRKQVGGLAEPGALKSLAASKAYILQRPRAPSERPSSTVRGCPLVVRSESWLEILEFLSTSSSTKIGQSTRNARASASLGRESMVIICPSRSTQISA